MKLSSAIVGVASVLGVASAQAQTSSFVNNGGVHEAYEYASDSFSLPVTSLLDKFTFTLAAPATLNAAVSYLGAGPISGTVSLYADLATDVLVGGFSFAAGSGTFDSLASGNYYYLVSEAGSKGGGFTLGSYATPVPEPQTYRLMLAGLGAAGFLALRRRK